MNNKYSKKGFQFAIINLILFISMFVVHLILHGKSKFYMTMFGYVGFVIIAIAIIGLLFSLKGIRESNSVKKIIAISLNGIFVLGFISMLIMVLFK